jgi:hypothetical protein
VPAGKKYLLIFPFNWTHFREFSSCVGTYTIIVDKADRTAGLHWKIRKPTAFTINKA